MTFQQQHMHVNGSTKTATWNGKAGAAGQQHITISTRQLLHGQQPPSSLHHTAASQGQQEHAPFGQQLTQGQHAHIFKARTSWAWTAPATPERDSTCWATFFHASSKLLGQQSTSGQQAPRTAKQHGLHDFPQAGSKDKKKGESLFQKRTNRERENGGGILGRSSRWTARGWKGFQHQILKGSPCIAKLSLGF